MPLPDPMWTIGFGRRGQVSGFGGRCDAHRVAHLRALLVTPATPGLKADFTTS